MTENKTMIIISMMSATLIAIAYLNMDKVAPTEPQSLTQEFNIEEEVIDWHKRNEIIVLDVDEMPFDEAFKLMRAYKGANNTFIWHGATYTTLLESEIPTNWIEIGGDIDDGFYCPDNYIDECGVCGGQGLRTWYIDNDGDGLGDPDTIVRTCEKPL